MNDSLETLRDFAHEIAWQAGKITLRYFQSGVAIDQKADESPVTIADRSAEAALRAAITARYPSHAILGEEDGLSGDSNATYRWVLDPIDGTKSFIRGVPLYGVMVGLLRENEPVVGVVHLPALNETVVAANGHGCFWNGRRCHVSTVASLRQSLVTSTTNLPADYERYGGKAAAFARICAAAGIVRTWGDCYAYVLVATGRAEVALDPAMNLWDAAALMPIMREAGGTYTDWQGNPTIEAGEGIGSNALVLPEVLALIRANTSA